MQKLYLIALVFLLPKIKLRDVLVVSKWREWSHNIKFRS